MGYIDIDFLAYLGLAYFGGHRRYIVQSDSPSQPVVADDNTICWGTFLDFFAFFV